MIPPFTMREGRLFDIAEGRQALGYILVYKCHPGPHVEGHPCLYLAPALGSAPPSSLPPHAYADPVLLRPSEQLMLDKSYLHKQHVELNET
jgi:hypothetical protein